MFLAGDITIECPSNVKKIATALLQMTSVVVTLQYRNFIINVDWIPLSAYPLTSNAPESRSFKFSILVALISPLFE